MPGGLLARCGLERQPASPVFPLDTFGDWLVALEDRYLEGAMEWKSESARALTNA